MSEVGENIGSAPIRKEPELPPYLAQRFEEERERYHRPETTEQDMKLHADRRNDYVKLVGDSAGIESSEAKEVEVAHRKHHQTAQE